MKTLVVYYSFTRNNELLARTIQKRLNCDIYKIEETGKRTGLKILIDLVFNRKPRIKQHPHTISSYEQCVFVSPIWAGKIASPLKTFLLQEKYNINRYSFITLCGGGSGEQKDKLVKRFTKLLEQEPGLVQELWINDLLPQEKKNTIKYTSGYRIQSSDLEKFDREIDDFVNSLESSYRLKQVIA